ncbi:MAG TPA: response regulator [Chthoniobacterales bacterium]|jgi:CheY-like chemotaxis protein
MFDHNDSQWLAATLTELNRQLHQASARSARARKQKSSAKQLQLLGEEVERAAKISQAVLDRVTSRIGVAATNKRKDKGPKFTVLPPPVSPSAIKAVVPKIRNDEGAKAPQTLIKNPNGRGELIMVIDDDVDILKLARSMLEEEDYRIILAKDGLEGLQIYSRMGREISLIILDFFLPVLNGDAIFDELKAIDPNVQVVLSSGFAEQTKLGSMLARGLRGFIPKPYTSQKLLEQVRSVIAA